MRSGMMQKSHLRKGYCSWIIVLAPLVLGLTMAFLAPPGISLWSSDSCQALLLPDSNEPNNNFAEATPLVNGQPKTGAILTSQDEDYFYIDIPVRSEVAVQFVTGGYPRNGSLAFQPRGSDMIMDLDWEEYDDDGSFYARGTIGPCRLFVMVKAGQVAPSSNLYTVTVSVTGAPGPDFSDVPPGSPYYEPIRDLARVGVVSGFSSTYFGVDKLLTRQQFAKMIVKAAGFPVSPSDICPFTDVPKSEPGNYMDPNDPLYPDHYIAVAASRHITQGVGGNRFAPFSNITLAQVVTMVVRTGIDLGIWDAPPHSYNPRFAPFGEPHYSYARTGAAHGLFDGYPGDYKWYSPATRGQCAFFIWKFMQACGWSFEVF